MEKEYKQESLPLACVAFYVFEPWKSGAGLETKKAKMISAKKQKAYNLRKELRTVMGKVTQVLSNYGINISIGKWPDNCGSEQTEE